MNSNPYLYDTGIWLPIWGLRRKLAQHAIQDPELAQQFINFLLEYRPLQRNLAAYLNHAAQAGYWQQSLLKPQYLTTPSPIENANKKFTPSSNWQTVVENLRQQLISYEKQNNIGLRVQAFQAVKQQLEQLYTLTLRESSAWNEYYLTALKQLQYAAEGQLQDLQQQAQNLESIAPNLYLAGSPLRPNYNNSVFIDRTDLKDQISIQLLTAQEMPLLLIRGQRRVGKTSLLNFLPSLLGSRFIILYQDLQHAKFPDITGWLNNLRQKFNQHFKLKEEQHWQPPRDWLKAWHELETYLLQHSQREQAKIVFALDEYENLHGLLQTQPEQGDRLLQAIRSFLQQQNQITFLLVGSAFLSELNAPNWINHFVQAQTLTVDYLTPEEAKRLITEPVKLHYPKEMIERMLYLTQGHPHLLQALCSTLVDYANRRNSHDMHMEDIDRALKDKLLDFGNIVPSLFWNQFCADPNCRQTVHELLEQQPISHRPSFNRLKRHGHLSQDDNGQWTLRVPLFAMWVQEFGE